MGRCVVYYMAGADGVASAWFILSNDPLKAFQSRQSTSRNIPHYRNCQLNAIP